MNEFTRIAMELADSYAESRESEATSKAEGDHGGWETALTQRRRSALLAHLEGGEQKWLPIETAPKDRTKVLVCGQWAGEIAGIQPETEIGVAYYSGRGDYEGFDWYEANSDAYAAWWKPTHWCPLPATPTEEASK